MNADKSLKFMGFTMNASKSTEILMSGDIAVKSLIFFLWLPYFSLDW
jgi:hypothetical protein